MGTINVPRVTNIDY